MEGALDEAAHLAQHGHRERRPLKVLDHGCRMAPAEVRVPLADCHELLAVRFASDVVCFACRRDSLPQLGHRDAARLGDGAAVHPEAQLLFDHAGGLFLRGARELAADSGEDLATRAFELVLKAKAKLLFDNSPGLCTILLPIDDPLQGVSSMRKQLEQLDESLTYKELDKDDDRNPLVRCTERVEADLSRIDSGRTHQEQKWRISGFALVFRKTTSLTDAIGSLIV